MVDQKYLDKAEVLIEALPYIRRFHDKIIVVKYGGSAMIDEELKREVIQDVVLLKLVGFRPIIVHGGGKEISRWVDKAGKETEFVGGLRVTDKETIEIAQMVLGKVNKDLVANVQTLGVQAAGISGMDGGMLKVEKKYVDGRDIGYVGDIKSVDTKILHDLMEQDFLPIVYPIGMDDNGDAYNINADEAASAIATALYCMIPFFQRPACFPATCSARSKARPIWIKPVAMPAMRCSVFYSRKPRWIPLHAACF